MQDEHDEQLRILNERELKEPELRKAIVNMRDKESVAIDKESLQSGTARATSWSTMLMMRLSRQL
jgi:hypothetical protein